LEYYSSTKLNAPCGLVDLTCIAIIAARIAKAEQSKNIAA
jgi:hypothetical protein